MEEPAPECLEQLYEEVEGAMPDTDIWSYYIRFGTPQSNQRFFLIHQALSNMCIMLAEEVKDGITDDNALDSNVRYHVYPQDNYQFQP